MEKRQYQVIDGRKLVAFRFALALTQADLAKRAKVSIGTVRRIEQNATVGDNHSRSGTLNKLAKALGVDQDELRDYEMESYDNAID